MRMTYMCSFRRLFSQLITLTKQISYVVSSCSQIYTCQHHKFIHDQQNCFSGACNGLRFEAQVSTTKLKSNPACDCTMNDIQGHVIRLKIKMVFYK